MPRVCALWVSKISRSVLLRIYSLRLGNRLPSLACLPLEVLFAFWLRHTFTSYPRKRTLCELCVILVLSPFNSSFSLTEVNSVSLRFMRFAFITLSELLDSFSLRYISRIAQVFSWCVKVSMYISMRFKNLLSLVFFANRSRNKLWSIFSKHLVMSLSMNQIVPWRKYIFV